MASSNLMLMYKAFTGGDNMMDGRQFAKLCKDCQIVEKGSLSVNDIDIIFAKVRSRGERKIEFGQFMEALQEVADRLDKPISWAKEKVVECDGPTISRRSSTASPVKSTRTSVGPSTALPPARPSVDAGSDRKSIRGPERFFYDQSSYTGVWRNGGPQTVDTGASSQKAAQKAPATEVTKRASGSTSTPAGKGRGPERFFYDTSTYTGVHKAGGPETVDRNNKDLKSLVDRRSSTSARGKAEEIREKSPQKSTQGERRRTTPAGNAVGPERFFYDTSSYTGTHRR